jgi:hypothetical protein
MAFLYYLIFSNLIDLFFKLLAGLVDGKTNFGDQVLAQFYGHLVILENAVCESLVEQQSDSEVAGAVF